MSSPPSPNRFAAVVIVCALFVVTLAVNLHVPLYERYAALAGYRHGVVSVTFAAYVAGLIPVLLLLGGLPLRFGNKVALVLGLAVALLAQALMLHQPTLHKLLATRVLQGISIGLALASGTAYLVEVGMGTRAVAPANAAAVSLGLASGALLTTTLGFAPAASLSPPSYAIVASATLVCLLATLPLPPGAKLRGARIVSVPLVSRHTLPFGSAIFASWSLTGLILVNGPLQLAAMGSAQYSGWLVFLAIASGLFVQLTIEVREPQRALALGYAVSTLSVLLLWAGLHQRSPELLLIAATLSGLSSFGFTYLGGLSATLRAGQHARVRAVAGYYLLGYLGFGLPCVAVGFVAERIGLEPSLLGYALLAGAALLLSRSWATRGEHAPVS